MRLHNLLLDVSSYNSSITAYEKAGQWHQALGLLVGRRHNDSLPKVMSCSSGISACEKSGHWQRAILLLLEMGQYDLRPNVISYNCAIQACVKSVPWQLVELRHNDFLPDVTCYILRSANE